MKIDWDSFDRGVFLVNVLGIIYDSKTKKIIIGLRKKDPYVRTLSWTLPGGRPGYSKDFENYLRLEVKKKTNLKIKINKVIFAKTYPKKRKFLSIYYLAEPLNAGKEKAGEKFTELKWVRISEVNKYFAPSFTSLHPTLMDFLNQLGDKK